MKPSTSRTAAQSHPPWHALDTTQIFQRVASRPDGLTQAEAEQRLRQYGPNRLPPPKRRGPIIRLLSQFHNVLIYVLLVAGLVTTLLDHLVDAGVIFGVVIVNAVIGFIQEGKAEKALEAVRRMLSLQATVIRDGRHLTIAADAVVPGDVVFVRAGDRVPADVRLQKIKDLRIDEAMLTGESVPVDKSIDPVRTQAPVGDRSCMAFSGTLVTYGQGSGVVVGTGEDTEIGRISSLLAQVHAVTTPLMRQLAIFGRWLTTAILVLAAGTALFGFLIRHYPLDDMFLAAVGLAVAAIPEGLPAIITITLAIGVQSMARRNAIIRRLPAVETLGSVTVICSDKTGTLTRNEMTVQTVATAARLVKVTGVGYDPHGGFTSDSGEDIAPSDHPELPAVCRAALLCNDATVREYDGQWRIEGDPTEGALVTLGLKARFDVNLLREEFPRTDVIPFESEHRFMATLHHDHAGHGFIYVKGAPEVILERCHLQRVDGDEAPLEVAYWHREIDAIARAGQRTLALAFKPATDTHRELHFDDVAGGLTLLGVVGIIDPPRQEAMNAIDQCRSAGIRVKMITGDHVTTAQAIAAQMGIDESHSAISGAELEQLDDNALTAKMESVAVFARASPEHKLRLVKVLQANAHVVAMTGDGVNDAPALKRADVGVAMGIKGTEAAKEAAEMVLADDNFASIAYAVEEGRTVYDNIKKSILFILPTNGGEALTILGAIAMGQMLPVTPVQILWVNMITAVTLALALAFEPKEVDVMQRPPREQSEPMLSGFMTWRVVFVSLLMVAGTFGLFLWESAQGAEIEVARTVAVNTLVVAEAFYLLNTRHLTAPVLSRTGLAGNRYVWIAIATVGSFQLLFTYTPLMQTFFTTANIGLEAWLRIFLVGISIFALVELEKFMLHHRRRDAKSRKVRSSHLIQGR